MQNDPDAVADTTATDHPTLAEELLLVLFQPSSGTFAGENLLFYALAGAMLADLAIEERVTATSEISMLAKVDAIADAAPDDPLLLSAWQYVAQKPRNVQTVLAAIGPTLRAPVLQRLIDRGDLVERKRKVLGVFPSKKLSLGYTGRREALIAGVYDVLVDGAEPTPRIAALIALVYGAGVLSHLHREIPWNSVAITRAEELKQGNWGAEAASQAVARTMAAMIANSFVVTTTIASR